MDTTELKQKLAGIKDLIFSNELEKAVQAINELQELVQSE